MGKIKNFFCWLGIIILSIFILGSFLNSFPSFMESFILREWAFLLGQIAGLLLVIGIISLLIRFLFRMTKSGLKENKKD